MQDTGYLVPSWYKIQEAGGIHRGYKLGRYNMKGEAGRIHGRYSVGRYKGRGRPGTRIQNTESCIMEKQVWEGDMKIQERSVRTAHHLFHLHYFHYFSQFPSTVPTLVLITLILFNLQSIKVGGGGRIHGQYWPDTEEQG